MPRPRLCKCGCGYPIPQGNTLRKAATVECALKLARRDIEKKERKAIREARQRLKTRQKWIKEAQAVFNKWVRLRDAELPCISCGRFHKGFYDAGHYRSVGSAPALRFEPLNVWRQCVPCNQHKSGNAIDYRINLVRRIGEERVQWLEGPHEPKKYTIDDLIELKKLYQAKIRELENKRALRTGEIES